ncbi:antagonist of KipI [Lewinella marina]|uniref:Carboxyltransferase domain-containing protein n=1 Tax=Neolewinella marina TaxID=438751 RepID=A0A2G0CJB5_9BACT|nr:biotin-dependent carboxyltransferase family protein [Neolewinella marina]NJB84771.1 antagonist of KipI [Neolewinella marina]PHL00070.1 hypothetical protein CGL56_03250 [Neolewinella marina]
MSRILTIARLSGGGGARFVDGGRPGLQHLAIPGGGAADRRSATTGNELLEQSPHHCCLELTLSGGRWQLNGRGSLALTGADMGWRLDGEPISRYETIALDGVHELRGGLARTGCRGYLCLRGGWRLPRVQGSVESGLPGTVSPEPGRSFLVEADDHHPVRSDWPPADLGAGQVVIPAVPGPEWDWLSAKQQRFLQESSFHLGLASDRQGIRLEAPGFGGMALPGMISSPVLPGTVQWTPAGPILLGPDAQTVGGYPRVLVAAPLPDAVFQLRPGEEVWFRLLTANP